ncbi:glycoside hydrolase family 99-like domain-containing protein [Afipia felis]|uniref:Trans-aconitate methyltransferase n=2 Tax=Afipia felis TaxID=1035 RepID=A0A380W2B8_AFIFE|nr:glycoside hydrolase family 99-like domain-containing protein [Afipia felis]EKS30297.1 hypothetical protein HMPREF9697_02825 [Afipia felis ATCC 53690]SUU75042.1 Trans-aconitate methyltransferase [Afipia felis]SUU83108.1 Trans-aconitate methyltransferase [Afipia felis]
MPGWDNSARRPHDGTIFYDASPSLFRKWLDVCFARASENPPDERLVFINAWNEWAEGAYLEPDRRYGYAYLTAVADAVEGRSSFGGKRFLGIEALQSLEAELFEEYVQNALSEQKAPEYTDVADEEAETGDVQLIAYYLPQFHPIPENDRWWGKGFTEWRNVARAFPLFEGHYQPRKPGELGYYDLRVPDVMRRQVELAKLYGISAFCFHFYWFGGKRLLETPIENFLNDKNLDLSFCLCWANENWSRRWDGSENEILMAQNHSDEDDEAFLRYLDKYFRDERYLKIDGKPVLTVYRPAILKDAAATTARWRRIAKELGYPDLYLIATNAFSFNDYEKYGFDALSEFPPHVIRASNVQDEIAMSPRRTGWRVRQYAEIVESEKERLGDEGRKIHPGVMPSWDNSARRPTNGEIIHGSTPELFGDWLRHAFSRAIKNPENERLIFVNAWNEWAEGAYLEPDQRFGYAYLEACASVALEYVNRDDEIVLRGKNSLSWEIIKGARTKQQGAKTILLCSHYSGAQVFGAERSLLDVATALNSAGFDVVATLPNSSNADYIEQLKKSVSEIHAIPYGQWESSRWSDYEAIESVQSFVSVIDRVHPDLIYANTVVLRAPLVAARFRNVPAIVHAREIVVHDPDIRALIGLEAEQIAGQIARSSDCIIANSKTTAESFAACHDLVVIPNIIDPEPFDMSNDVVDGLVKFGLISSNEPKKGVEDFIELARLSKQIASNARFLVIGQQHLDGIQDYLSGKKQYPDNLSFVDYQSSAMDAIRLVNVVVSTSSFQESFGRTVLEGMAASRPTLAYDWGAVSELVDPNVTGFLVPFKNIDAAAQCVKVFCEDIARLKRMGEAARLQAREKCRLDVFRDKLAEICNRVIDNHRCDNRAYKDVSAERLAHVNDKTIDVVVCVHNALQDVEACLESVRRYLGDKHRLLIVDDCSDEPTRSYLATFAKQHPSILLLRNDERAGYTRSANKGLQASTADLVILLNSDTIVSERWAEKMADAVFSTRGAGIVSPMSNAASYQSLPDVESSGPQTATNELPANCGSGDVDRFCEVTSYARFPVVPMVHGFCFGITREAVNSLGYFDEVAFKDGYGEENDYCLRAFRAGIWSVIATNTFVYHAKSKSYSAARRAPLARKGQAQLYKTHGRWFFNANVEILKEHPDLERMRIMFRRMWPKGQKPQDNFAEPIWGSPKNLSRLDDAEWLSMLKRSAKSNVVDGVTLPSFPEDSIQIESVGSAGETTVGEAFNFYSLIRDQAEKIERPIQSETKILDFGAGWGRMIRCFWRDADPSNIHGVDVSERYLTAARKTGIGNLRTISPTGTLPYPDHSFDIVYAYSVFTHLPKHVQDIWLPEIARVLRPGGLLVATVEPRRFYDFVKDLNDETKAKHVWYQMLSDALARVPDAEDQLEKTGFLFLPTNNIDTYGDTVMTPEYVEAKWTRYFRILDYLDDSERFFQAVVSAQKV